MSRSYEEFIKDTSESNTFFINGIHYFYDRKNLSRDDVRDAVNCWSPCNCCISRTKKFCYLIGSNGPVFLDNIKGKFDGDSEGKISDIRDKIVSNLKSESTRVFDVCVVRSNTFPPIQEGFDEETKQPWEHFTIHPDKFTPDELADKIEPLFNKYFPIIGTRLEKLTMPESIESVKIIYDELINGDKITRTQHWKSVFDWIIGVQNYCNGIDYSSCGPRKKKEIEIYAITTGRYTSNSVECVHKDYQQAANVTDFIVMEDIDSIAQEMNTRSDPNNYMVSQFARRMAKEKVNSKWFIGLSWPTEYTDDLDLHVYPENGQEIFYGNKSVHYNGHVCRLDFDANVTRGETEPCENVSVCPGTFTVKVNNYTRRTHNKEIPFTIVIHQEGRADQIIERNYPCCSRGKIIIGTFTFTDIHSSGNTMSDKAISRANVLNGKWMELFGNPTSTIPYVSDFKDQCMYTFSHDSTPVSNNVNDAFMNMTVKQNRLNGKKFLSQHVKDKIPDTLTALLEYVKKGNHQLYCDPRSFSPGYITRPNTKTQVLKSEYTLNNYGEKFKHPTKPVMNSLGNARFDSKWFSHNTLFRNEMCTGFYKINGFWFMTIDNCQFSVADSDFPRSNGFYPTDLLSHVHDLRDRWTASNIISDALIVRSDQSIMVGSFLTNKELNFYLNGNCITVKNM